MLILLQLLATRAGSFVNNASIGRDLRLNVVATRICRNLLNSTFVTYGLKFWYRNACTIVKSSKVFFYDIMQLWHLLKPDLGDMEKNQNHQFDHVLENFVLTER